MLSSNNVIDFGISPSSPANSRWCDDSIFVRISGDIW
jgi:hypothetical protein